MHLEYSKRFALKHEVDALEQMFKDASEERKQRKDLHSVIPRKKDKRLLKRYRRQAKNKISILKNI